MVKPKNNKLDIETDTISIEGNKKKKKNMKMLYRGPRP